ncbi:MAG: RNA 3'-terminal phosphate cyclase [Sandaracinaceae bacterium]|nr:RNA 3'-terminal phosphate cyclase [Sandaracinaceae bacterium]
MTSERHIDGSQGEGGGQVLRTSLALSAITGTPVRVTRVRAGRSKSGLLRQHLTALRAAAEISGARVEGDELGSQTLRFTPGRVRAGRYHFAVGTAGSACLVCQTVLPMLLMADGPSEVVFEGGTHAMGAPSFDFFARVFVPLLRRMGAELEVTLERHGFYPAGGGRFVLRVQPVRAWTPLSLVEPAPLRVTGLTALVANLPFVVAQRELAHAGDALGVPAELRRGMGVKSPGPGNVLMVELASEHGTEQVTAFGRRGVSAEAVAQGAVVETEALLRAGVSVGPHLADQLLLPMALAGGGALRTTPLTLHSRTNLAVIQQFMPLSISDEADGSGVTTLTLRGTA